MYKECSRCGCPIHDGDRIMLMVVSIYKEIPSRIAFATSTPVDSDPSTLQHEECYRPGEGY